MNTIGIYKNAKPPYIAPLIKQDDVRQIWVDGSPLLKEGDIVKVSFKKKISTKKSKYSEKYYGKILEKITGTEEDLDKLIVAAKYQLDKRFKPKVLTELETLLELKDEFPDRQTIENEFIVTIDSEYAKDLDDAVSLRKTGQHYELSVYIADVSHFVRIGSEIDQEAYLRGTSIYYANDVIPMLPKLLSNNYCSLNAGEEKLVMAVKMTIDKAGKVLSHTIFPARIIISERWSYNQVNKMLMSPGHDIASKNALLMRDMLKIIKTKRLQEGSIDFDMDEIQVRIGDDGKVVSIDRIKRGDAEKMIEEFMLLANKTVAKFLSDQNIPSMYRIHDIPDVIKIDNFNNVVRPLNMGCVNLNAINPQSFQAIISRTRDNEYEKLINLMVLRTMQAAKYSVENIGHFGLSFDHYTHFTSPIRRYPDLIVHRLLKHVIQHKKAGRKPLYTHQEMEEIATHSSITEKNATDIERYYLKLKQVRFLKQKIGKTFHGIISGVSFNGVYVELVDYPVEGLLPKSLMMDDYYIYDEKQNIYIGRKNHKVLMLGKKIRVKVAKVDDTRFFVDFESVEL